MATTNISEIKKLVKPDVLACPDPIMNREIVSVILDFCKNTNIMQREFELSIDSNDIDTDTQNCVDFDISEHSLDLRPTAVMEILIDSQPYVPFLRNIKNTLTAFDYTPGAAGASVSADDRFKYFWLPDNQTIRVFDMSSSDSNIYFKIAVKPLRSATTIDTDIFEDWSEALVAGAKYKILKMPGKEWSDPKSAAGYRRDYRKYLSEAKRRVLAGGTSVHEETIKWKSFEF
jgi:hypothetical protein